MSTTTIKIKGDTKEKLDQFREHMNESYDAVIKKVVFIAEKSEDNARLSKETLKAIRESRKRMAKGEYYTWEEVKKRLNL